MKICNLHNIRFEDGKDKIIADLNNCIQTGEISIQFIHGYHGHAFKDYIQSADFIRDMEEEGIFLTLTGINSKGGMTEFRIDIPAKTESIASPEVNNSNKSTPKTPIPKKKMNLEEAKAFFDNRIEF
jgi:hypothetical protein